MKLLYLLISSQGVALLRRYFLPLLGLHREPKNGGDISGLSLVQALFMVLTLCLVSLSPARAETLCAKAQMQLSQKVTTERQAFIATMAIGNGLPVPLKDVHVDITFTTSTGSTVDAATAAEIPTPAAVGATPTYKFFYTTSGNSMPATIPAKGGASASWLIIPTPTSGGTLAEGKNYLIGATLKYTVSGEIKTIVITPSPITVKPLPELELDYFITYHVMGDEPTTPEVEPLIPFTFGLRIRNVGAGTAPNLKIESGQPKIVTNEQGLKIAMKLISAEVNGAAQPLILQLNLGNILPDDAAVARWGMTASLSGTFTELKATFTHADALGGQLTSLIRDPIHTHYVIHDVLLSTGDSVRDFLALEAPDTPSDPTPRPAKAYGSNGIDVDVADLSVSSGSLQSTGAAEGKKAYTMTTPATGPFYATKPDLELGLMSLQSVCRSDGVLLNPANFWLYAVYDEDIYKHRVGIFDDTNTTGLSYTLTYAPITQTPVLQDIADQTVLVNVPYTLEIKATDPDQTIPVLSASNLPDGATFVDGGAGTGTLSWTNPTVEQKGPNTIQFTARNGKVSVTKSAIFTVGTSGYDLWKQRFFGDAASEVNSQDDPAHDGLTNLVKYALGLDPTKAELQSSMVIGQMLVSGKHYLTLTYTHRTDDPDLSFSVMGSNISNADDSQWTAQTHSIQLDEADQAMVPSGMKMEKVRDSVAIEDGPLRRFLKLKVTLHND